MAVFRTEADHIYRINDTKDGAYFTDGPGHLMDAEALTELPSAIDAFIQNFSSFEELDSFVKNYNKKIDDNLASWGRHQCNSAESTEKQVKRGKFGHVYMLECGGKYKIGFSANVERRMAQLDTRPFPLELVVSSKELHNAYDIEQKLHEKLSEYKVAGEWYDLPANVAATVQSHINELEETEV